MSLFKDTFYYAGADKVIKKAEQTRSLGKEEPTLPSEYFSKHKSKPIIVVYKVEDEDLPLLFKRVRDNIGQATKEAVSAFMWHFMGKIEEKLDKQWNHAVLKMRKKISYPCQFQKRSVNLFIVKTVI